MRNSYSKKISLKSRLLNLLTLVSFISIILLIPQKSQAKNFAPDLKVTGKVTDEKSSPLSNVSIVVKGTSKGVTSDLNGNFSITVPDNNAVLVVSYVGYKTKEVPVGGQTNLTVTLAASSEQLTDVVVVGYGTQKKVTVTGAVSAVKGAELVKSPAVDLSNSLAGRLPGLVVIQQSGEPGSDAATITIRGTNTLGNSSPLVVIDGVADRDGGLGRVNPVDIDNISVLKDASAAIYGARAANGVILITTKKGTIGKPTISFDFNQGFAQPALLPEMSDAVEYATIMNELPIYKSIPANEWSAAWKSIQETGAYDSPTPDIPTLNANYSPEAVKKYGEGSDPWGYPNTDWFGDAFQTWAPQSRYSLRLSGGNENVRYFTSIGYLTQDAYYKNSANRYQQYDFRINLTAKINDYINTSLGLLARRELRNYPTEGAGGIFRMLMRGRPTEPEVWPNGLPGPDIENGQNPYVITTNATGYSKNPRDYVQANGSVDITNPWVKGLKLTLFAAIDKHNETRKLWQTPWTLYYWDRITYEDDGVTPKLVGAVRSNYTDARLTEDYAQVLNTNLTALLSYDKKIGSAHTLGVMAGVTKETYKSEGFQAFRRNYISSAIDQFFAGGATQTADNNFTDYPLYNRARLGYYGRAQYNYKEKYLAEFICRYDGSYIFPEDKRFGFFPGLLLGWNITNEKFFNVTPINYLKLRASYGQMGNDQVAYDVDGDGDPDLQEYAFLNSYVLGSYPINSALASTLGEVVLANPDFTWEVANNYNVGLDASLFGNKIDLTLEYFYNKRDKILIQKLGSTPNSTGFFQTDIAGNRHSLLPPVNGGRVDNRGFEFSLGYKGKIGRDITFRAGINGGYAKNKVVYIDETPGIPDYQKQEGKPINAYLAYESDGAFLNEDDIAKNTIDYSGVTGQLIPGDMKFKDVNNDGKITADDAVRQDKNITPPWNFGATFEMHYKGFDFSFLFQGAAGAEMPIETESGDIGNYLKYSYDHRWSIDHPSSTDPRLASREDTYYTGASFGNNTYFLFGKDYIRLKNIELAYNLPSAFLKKYNISNIRLFVNGLNVFTIDKYKIYDPEATVERGVYYPQPRVINGGISITF